MLNDPHIIYIGVRIGGFGHEHGIIPEPETIDPIIALRHGKERLSIDTFHPGYQQEFSIQQDGPWR